ncbi:MAG: polymerase subunit sigma-24 [Verrucomicrobiales bacterium]|nr:polymerase subunit sigma-24 [Verrucomicrobiales bacterium]
MDQELDFEMLVELHYPALYRFAFSLTRQESDARDLTQQTFYIWAKKGTQLNDKTKAKSWLFTTLHREFLVRRRKIVRFPEVDLGSTTDLPEVAPKLESADAPLLLQALARIDPSFQAAVSLFYLEDYSYAEIAGILEIPLGTVKSRIARGVGQLQRLLITTERAISGRNP